jgi:hypothetical protein
LELIIVGFRLFVLWRSKLLGFCIEAYHAWKQQLKDAASQAQADADEAFDQISVQSARLEGPSRFTVRSAIKNVQLGDIIGAGHIGEPFLTCLDNIRAKLGRRLAVELKVPQNSICLKDQSAVSL